MKPMITRGSRRKPIIMEVVGKNGRVIGKYVDKPDKESNPYVLIEEARL